MLDDQALPYAGLRQAHFTRAQHSLSVAGALGQRHAPHRHIRLGIIRRRRRCQHIERDIVRRGRSALLGRRAGYARRVVYARRPQVKYLGQRRRLRAWPLLAECCRSRRPI